LRNDGRVWVPRNEEDRDKDPKQIPKEKRYYYLEEKYPAFGNLVPRDVASRNAKLMVDDGLGVGPLNNAVYLDFADAIREQGKDKIEEKYGNLFHMYEKITGENPYEVPMRIFPAVHYVMGGLWVDYDLMSNVPGLFVAGEANFSDHGANRLGASALMQGLADGYFVISRAVSNYLAENRHDIDEVDTDQAEFEDAEETVKSGIQKLLDVSEKNAKKPADERNTVMELYRRLGRIMWDNVGIARNAEGLQEAIEEIRELRDEFWNTVYIPGDSDTFNKNLEVAGRVADFLEMGELMARDALDRDESAGCHFREEHQTEEGEALRDDDEFAYVAAWEHMGQPGKWDSQGEGVEWKLNKESLVFENVELKQRSYK
jgi:succinate dehydrogenase / fumarate reductase flavoprotein subunit